MTIDDLQNGIIEEMSALSDWFDKYEHIVALGRQMPPIDPNLKTEENRIKGCQSQTWISARQNEQGMEIQADSDSQITRGMIAQLLRVLNHQPPQAVANADLYYIREIGLSTNLSPSRANGLALIVQHLKQHAADLMRE